MPIETYKCPIFRGWWSILIHGLQIRITRCIVIGRLSKQQQDIRRGHHSRTQSPSYARSTERDEGLWPNPYQTGIWLATTKVIVLIPDIFITMFSWYPVMDLARAPRRAARKKGSGYENERPFANSPNVRSLTGNGVLLFWKPTNDNAACNSNLKAMN